jgi:hypothetical protein
MASIEGVQVKTHFVLKDTKEEIFCVSIGGVFFFTCINMIKVAKALDKHGAKNDNNSGRKSALYYKQFLPLKWFECRHQRCQHNENSEQPALQALSLQSYVPLMVILVAASTKIISIFFNHLLSSF